VRKLQPEKAPQARDLARFLRASLKFFSLENWSKKQHIAIMSGS
jgi:hypothetical protein